VIGVRPRELLLNPYCQIAAYVIAITAAEITLKIGASSVAGTDTSSILAIDALWHWFTWIGIACYIAGLLLWLNVLRVMPLVKAYSLATVIYAMVPAAAWLVLDEKISITRGIGIALVLAGVLAMTTASAKIEEEL
jgi:drug/metabolite transporter (DMT)-like permease